MKQSLETKKRTTQPARPQPVPPFKKQHQEAPGSEAKLEPKPRFAAPNYHAAGKLSGLKAFITGGDSGIGRAVAVLYAREGADIAISYLPEEQEDADVTKAQVEKLGGRCLLLPGDLSESALCDELITKAVKGLGSLDILVCNAAHQMRKPRLEDVTDEEFDKTFRTNIYAYFWMVRASLPHLKPGACIIATSSETGLLGSPNLTDYSATKGAMNAFTKALAKSLIDRGIRVNAVAPGPVWTPLNPSDKGLTAEQVAEFGKDTPMGRPAQPEEIAPAFVFLASSADSSYITGIVLPIMGGETV